MAEIADVKVAGTAYDVK